MLKVLLQFIRLLSLGTLCLGTSNKLSEVDYIRIQYISLEKSLWNTFHNENIPKIDNVNKIFNNHLEFINNNLNIEFDDKIIFQFNKKHSEWTNLKKDLLEIDQLFIYFRTVLNKYYEGKYDEYVAIDLAETLMNNMKLSAIILFEKIDNVMIKIISYYRGMLNGEDQLSLTRQSSQQFLFSVYTNITLTELKKYAMMQFSFMILEICSKSNYTHKSRSMREHYVKATAKTRRVLQLILLDADRIVWQSDPSVHIKNKTYDDLTQFLQGYIENEADLNPSRTCSETCQYYEFTKNNGCYKETFCTHNRKCNGNILNCRYIDSELQVCLSPPNSSRRYEYMQTGDNRVLGEKKTCNKMHQANSWNRGLYNCHYCLCFCEDIRSDRYFNLKETNSDVKANMAVTGLRFVKHNNIFHIQIQEGELMPKGQINLKTVRWRPVDNYHYFDGNVKPGVDFHTLEWNKCKIDLDTINYDPSYIVTGVRFKLIGTHLNLQVKFSEYNFETGKLINAIDGSLWIFNENNDFTRKKINLQNSDIPIRSAIRSRPISTNNEYIEFTNSDIYKDAAQSTVPFIDIQAVVSEPPVPVSGCGIYFKGRKQYGGFIAPKLITYSVV